MQRPRTSPETRGLLLAWLFHDVGDIHQPLHSSALFSTRLFPDGDRGGNSVKTREAGNLHSLWDGFAGRNTEFRTAHNKAIGHGHRVKSVCNDWRGDCRREGEQRIVSVAG